MSDKDVAAPKGSKCATCVRFDAGACPMFQTVVRHHGRIVPIKHCGAYVAAAKPPKPSDSPEEQQ